MSDWKMVQFKDWMETNLPNHVLNEDEYQAIYSLWSSKESYKNLCNEWLDKTMFLQEMMNGDILDGTYLGMHRADVARKLIIGE